MCSWSSGHFLHASRILTGYLAVLRLSCSLSHVFHVLTLIGYGYSMSSNGSCVETQSLLWGIKRVETELWDKKVSSHCKVIQLYVFSYTNEKLIDAPSWCRLVALQLSAEEQPSSLTPSPKAEVCRWANSSPLHLLFLVCWTEVISI
jgi:hypothetical protein